MHALISPPIGSFLQCRSNVVYGVNDGLKRSLFNEVLTVVITVVVLLVKFDLVFQAGLGHRFVARVTE